MSTTIGGIISVASMPPRITFPKIGRSLDRAYAADTSTAMTNSQPPTA